MTTCPCGSDRFNVTYQAAARVAVIGGVPTAVTFDSDASQLFASVTCAICQVTLDIDDTVIGPGGAPGTAMAGAALTAVRATAETFIEALPKVTVRAHRQPSPRAVVQLPAKGAFSRRP